MPERRREDRRSPPVDMTKVEGDDKNNPDVETKLSQEMSDQAWQTWWQTLAGGGGKYPQFRIGDEGMVMLVKWLGPAFCI